MGRELKKTQKHAAAAAAKLVKISKNLVLEGAAIDQLNVEQLNLQLDFQWDTKNNLEMDSSDGIPTKSNIGKKEIQVQKLKNAVRRYLACQSHVEVVIEEVLVPIPMEVEENDELSRHDLEYNSDFYDDYA